MRKQYYFRPSKRGFYAWDVDKLVALSKNFPVISVKLTSIRELDEPFWYNPEGSTPTCRSIVEHLKLVEATDLTYPIILSKKGRVMDGMHRVVKALILGQAEIKAVQFEEDPPPDYTDVQENDLPYD